MAYEGRALVVRRNDIDAPPAWVRYDKHKSDTQKGEEAPRQGGRRERRQMVAASAEASALLLLECAEDGIEEVLLVFLVLLRILEHDGAGLLEYGRIDPHVLDILEDFLDRLIMPLSELHILHNLRGARLEDGAQVVHIDSRGDGLGGHVGRVNRIHISHW